MKTTNPHPSAPRSVLTAEPSEVGTGPQGELPSPDRVIAGVASERRLEALEQSWEAQERRRTAAEVYAMSTQRLRRLCDEAFAALDFDFPAWGARDEYEILSAELTIRAKALKNRPQSAHD